MPSSLFSAAVSLGDWWGEGGKCHIPAPPLVCLCAIPHLLPPVWGASPSSQTRLWVYSAWRHAGCTFGQSYQFAAIQLLGWTSAPSSCACPGTWLSPSAGVCGTMPREVNGWGVHRSASLMCTVEECSVWRALHRALWAAVYETFKSGVFIRPFPPWMSLSQNTQVDTG